MTHEHCVGSSMELRGQITTQHKNASYDAGHDTENAKLIAEEREGGKWKGDEG